MANGRRVEVGTSAAAAAAHAEIKSQSKQLKTHQTDQTNYKVFIPVSLESAIVSDGLVNV
jgi:hypothetical protein